MYVLFESKNWSKRWFYSESEYYRDYRNTNTNVLWLMYLNIMPEEKERIYISACLTLYDSMCIEGNQVLYIFPSLIRYTFICWCLLFRSHLVIAYEFFLLFVHDFETLGENILLLIMENTRTQLDIWTTLFEVI